MNLKKKIAQVGITKIFTIIGIMLMTCFVFYSGFVGADEISTQSAWIPLNIATDSLQQENLNLTYFDDLINYQTSYLNKNVSYKDSIIPTEIQPMLKKWTFTGKVDSENDTELNFQIEFDTVSLVPDYLKGRKVNGKVSIKKGIIKTDLYGGIYDDNSGNKIFDIKGTSHYEHLVLNFNYYAPNGTLMNTYENIYSGEETILKPVTYQINKYDDYQEGQIVDRAMMLYDNLYGETHEVNITVAYPKDKEFLGLNYIGEITEISNQYNSVVSQSINSEKNSTLIIGDLNNYTFKSFNINISNNTIESISFKIPSEYGEYNDLRIWVEGSFAGGSGTSVDPYQIETWEDLKNISNYLSSDFILMNDLGSGNTGYDTYASSSANSGAGWLPLGNSTTKFEGNFNGGNNTISDVYINRSAEDNIGLFGYCDWFNEIYNLKLFNFNITGGDNVGGLVGKVSLISIYQVSIIDSSITSAGDGSVGGLLGYVYGQSGRFIEDCYANNVTVFTNYNYIGVFRADANGIQEFRNYAVGTYSTSYIGDGFGPYSNGGTHTDNFFDSDVSEDSSSNYATAKTTQEMKTIETYSNWDIIAVTSKADGYANHDYIWNIVNGSTYPFLSWEYSPADNPPTYSNVQTNSTVAGEKILFSIQYNDGIALNPNGQYIFSTNNTGTWTNESAVNFTATPSWANVTKTLNSTEGISIGYRWYADDNAGNINNTEIFTLTTTSANTAPTLTANATSPSDVYTNTDYLINLTITDPDGDTLTGYVQFYKNDIASGSVQSQVATVDTNTLIATLANANFVKGDVLIAEVWAGDGTENITKVNLTSETVLNSLPTIGNPTLNDSMPYTNEVLLCTNGSYSDTDGDSATWYYRWYDTGVLISGQNSNTLDLTVAGLDKGDTIKCSTIASDGTDNATAWTNSTEATIQNSAPIITPTQTTVSKDADGTAYTYDYNFTDADGDSVIWSDNTTLFNINSSTGIISDTPTESEAETYSILITTSDGTDTDTDTFAYTINDVTAPAVSSYYQWNSTNQTVDFGLWTEGFVSINWNLTDTSGINTSTCQIKVRNKNIATNYTNLSIVEDVIHPDYDTVTGYKNLTCYTEDLGDGTIKVSANMTRSYDWRPLITALDQDVAVHDNSYANFGAKTTKMIFHNISSTINTTFIFYADIDNQSATVADLLFYSCNSSYTAGDFTDSPYCSLVGSVAPGADRDVNFGYLIGALTTDENGMFGGILHTETMYGMSYCPDCSNTNNAWLTYSTNGYDGHSSTSSNLGSQWTDLSGEEFNVILHAIDNTQLEFNLTIEDNVGNQLSVLQTDTYGALANLAPFGDIQTDNITGSLVSYYDIHGVTESGTIWINATVSDPNADDVNCSIYLLNNDSSMNQTLLANYSIAGFGICPYEWNTSTIPDGDYRLNVTAFDGSLTGYDESAGYIKINAIPVITKISPNTNIVTTSLTQTYSYNISDNDNITKCSLLMDGSIVANDTSINKSETNSFSYTQSTGTYIWSIQCSDEYNTATTDNFSIQFYVEYGGGGGTSYSYYSKCYNIVEDKCVYRAVYDAPCPDNYFNTLELCESSLEPEIIEQTIVEKISDTLLDIVDIEIPEIPEDKKDTFKIFILTLLSGLIIYFIMKIYKNIKKGKPGLIYQS